jgi:hypothetical protein
MEPKIGTPVVVICAAFLSGGHVCPPLLLKIPILMMLLDDALWNIPGWRKQMVRSSDHLPDEGKELKTRGEAAILIYKHFAKWSQYSTQQQDSIEPTGIPRSSQSLPVLDCISGVIALAPI